MASQIRGLKHHIFAYGTLKSGQPNNHYLQGNVVGQARFVAAARTVESFPLVIGTEWNLPFLLHIPGKGHQIYGEVYDIDDACLSWMDEFEGHPTFYERSIVKVSVLSSEPGNDTSKTSDSCKSDVKSEEIMECWAYFLKNIDKRLLQLEMLSCYSSDGAHNRVYIAKEDRSTSENIADALKEECDKLTVK